MRGLANHKFTRLDKEILEAKVIKLRAGDKTVVDAIVESHIPLVITIASQYSRFRPQQKDQIISDGLCGLCQAVEWASTRMYDNEITPYISTTVRRHIRDGMEKRSLIPIPRRTFKKLIQDEDFNGNKILSSEDIPEVCIKHHYEHLETTDLYKYLHLSKREKRVLAMRMASHTLKEIGEAIGVSKEYVFKIIAAIRERWVRYENSA